MKNGHLFYRFSFTILIATLSIFSVFHCSEPPLIQSIFNVPDGYELESVVAPDLIDYPMFASFDDRGRLFVFESTETNDMETDSMLSNPSYQIRLLTDRDQDGIFDQASIFAGQIPFPMGGTYFDGSLFVAASPDIIKLTDTDNDGQADRREVILTGWTLNSNGAILSGPFMSADGWMYVADARRGYDITTREGERMQGKSARVWRFLPDGSRLEWLSGGGFDNSIEIDFMPSGDPIGTMTYFRDPADGQRDALIHWVKGGVYPKPHAVIEQDQYKLTGDLMPVVTKMPRIAPSGIVRFTASFWGPEFEGNWFSAIFNTGQILRHSLKQVGASYTSIDTVFLSSDLPDIHPTDVLQDGNGDLLVVVTGGWFIHGCPLSQVAKPEVAGGIYRIRKKNTKYSSDSWGTKVPFSDLSIEELSGFLDDERSMVRKNALEQLITRGPSALPILEKRMTSEIEEVRIKSLFAIGRMGTEKGNRVLIAALEDPSAVVRTAAARLAGLNLEKRALAALETLVVNDPDLGVRRQAATALGQLGDPRSIPTLILASRQIEDRFLLHAIRYALISLGEPELLLKALEHEEPSIRISSLIALDQMENSILQSDHLEPFLKSENHKLREAGIWVLRHHPDWSVSVSELAKQWLDKQMRGEDEIATLEALLLPFCHSEDIQDLIFENIVDNTIALDLRCALLRIVGRCSATLSPGAISALSRTMHSPSKIIQDAVLQVIEMKQIKELAPVLSNFLENTENDPILYLKVLSARVVGNPNLSEGEFNKVFSFLNKPNNIPVQRLAVQLLSRASLNNFQLMHLAGEGVLKADQITFPGVLELFKKDSTRETGEILIASLKNSQHLVSTLTENDLQSAISSYPDVIRVAAEPILEVIRQANENRWSELTRIEAGLIRGDVNRGRHLFFGKALCSTCHTVGMEGNDFGPDLTNIGEIRSRHDLLEAIIYPSVSFAREYETYAVKTNDRIYSGILHQASADGVAVIKLAPEQVVNLEEDKIESVEQTNNSMMPVGLDNILTNQELSDLISYLEALPYHIERLIEISNKEVR